MIKRCLRGSLIRERPQSPLSNSKLQAESNHIFHHLKKALKKVVPEYSQRDTVRGQSSGRRCRERELKSEMSLGSQCFPSSLHGIRGDQGSQHLKDYPFLWVLDEWSDKRGLRTFVYGRISENRKYPKGNF